MLQKKVLYVMELGLGDEKDVTMRGLQVVRRCDKVYLEAYISFLGLDLDLDATVTLVRPSLMSILTMKCKGCWLFVEF